jgi:lysophospholipase L1-like esterase
MVDMEKGAGLDYSDNLHDSATSPPYEGGDMRDNRYPGVSPDLFHPNEKGNYKIAVKYYQELVKELPERK